MRIMRLLVIATLLPATEYKPFCSPISVLLNFISFFCTIFPLHQSLQSKLMIANVTYAVVKLSICLTFLPLPWCLFFFHHVVHHLSILAEKMQCAPSGLQISGKAFWSQSLNNSPNTIHNHWLLFILQFGERRLQWQVSLEHNAHRANKAERL